MAGTQTRDAVSDNLVLWRGSAHGEFVSSRIAMPPFDRAVLSWNCSGPARFEIEIDGAWHVMGEWGRQPRSLKSAIVDIDTLLLESPAESLRIRAHSPAETTVSLLAVMHWLSGQALEYLEEKSPVWGQILDVPRRSQLIEKRDAMSLCSPTSLAMVLDYYGIQKETREVADAVYDHAEQIYGNWPFNVAYAHDVLRGPCFVCKGTRIEDIEGEILAGRPVIVSHRWEIDELDDAPLPRSNGHLLVVVGFTSKGDVVVNDPAGPPRGVRRIYKRRQFHKTWLGRGCGVQYLIRPA